MLLDLDRLEYNTNQKETRRHTTLDNGHEDSGWPAVEDENIEALFADPPNEELLRKAISHLKPKQQELIKSIFFEEISVCNYALKEGVSQPAISQRLGTAIKKLKKLL